MKEQARSDSYRFTTTDRNDPRIAALKALVKDENTLREWVDTTTYRWPHGTVPCQRRRRQVVNLKGRAGKNNPNVTRKQMRDGSVPLGVATRFDVYVHERWEEKVAPEHEYRPTPPQLTTSTAAYEAKLGVVRLISGILNDPKFSHLDRTDLRREVLVSLFREVANHI